MTPATMKAARVAQRGAAEFSLETLPTPRPEPGQLLIRVESAGVNFSDVKRRRGDAYPFETVFPFVPGGEVAGTVVAHGPGVDSPPLGARVFALAGADGLGGYAQFAVAYASTAVRIPPELDFDAASVLLVAGTTAHVLLAQAARLQAGESVLVPAATGGVGSFAVQIARQRGASRVVAAVGHEGKGQAARDLGAHEVVVTSQADWPQRVLELTGGIGVDVALEASGGASLRQTLQCLAPFGRLVVYGAASGESARLDAAQTDRWLYDPAPNQSISGFNIGAWFMQRPQVAGAALMELVQDCGAGRLQLPKITTLPLAQAAQAHRSLESRQVQGKLVLKPWA